MNSVCKLDQQWFISSSNSFLFYPISQFDVIEWSGCQLHHLLFLFFTYTGASEVLRFGEEKSEVVSSRLKQYPTVPLGLVAAGGESSRTVGKLISRNGSMVGYICPHPLSTLSSSCPGCTRLT